MGREAADVGLVLLSVATFLLVFALVLLGPRFVRRRARSFRLIADGSLDEIEMEVRRVLEELGHRVDERPGVQREAAPPARRGVTELVRCPCVRVLVEDQARHEREPEVDREAQLLAHRSSAYSPYQP